MKKTIALLVVMFVVTIACKKINKLCGCEPPIRVPDVNFAVINADGTDLLDDKKNGAFTPSKIQFYTKDASGQATPLQFSLKPPMIYGEKAFQYYSLYLPVNFLVNSVDKVFYLKLNKEYKLKAVMNTSKYNIDELLIDDKPLTKDDSELKRYANMYYISL
ncbi:hypothetical protein CKK33_13180 [Mucilaginibacter sp. MD40]|uniref:hypothetical protein n=1 Tax=Mucilaginibacter sp. MD40 TaxID=2029590 RepID=UPI000BACAAE4|nr:hypothetical protein [Mucilaginibacter sp. MD40]PAW94390.1 hypothetical protein CKK33_13180 [Mucilaginibacter sp. MD40]